MLEWIHELGIKCPLGFITITTSFKALFRVLQIRQGPHDGEGQVFH